MAALCEVASSTFGLGEMAFGYFYDATGATLNVSGLASTRNVEPLRRWMHDQLPVLSQAVPVGLIAKLYDPSPRVELVSDAARIRTGGSAAWEQFRPALGPNISDILGVRAGDIDRKGLLLALPIAPKHRITARSRAALERVAAHLAAAARLRRQSQDLDHAAAILDTRGRLQHLSESEAPQLRGTFSEAVQRIERARTKAVRHDGETSLSMWQALVDGHWSVVDHHDSDGKRLIVARRNEPVDRASKPIRDCRQQVLELASLGYTNKLIAYELGLSPAAVSGHLKRGLEQLGLNSRQELIAIRESRDRTPKEKPR